MMLIVLAALSLVFILLEVPIAFAILGSSIITVIFDPWVESTIIPSVMIQGMDSFILLAIPLFVLVGMIMNSGGITNRLLNLAIVMVGRLPGGLAHVNVLGSMIFSGMSGATTSDVAGLGRVEIPMMIKAGYKPAVAASVTAVSACIGPIVPPSVPFILYGALTDTSVGRLFLAGAIPGILLGFSFMGVIALDAMRGKYADVEGKTLDITFWQALKDGSWALITPVIIIGGIIAGLFTPTEAAGIAVFYALFITMVIYRELTFKDLWKILCDASEFVGLIMFVVASAFIFGWLLTQGGIADILLENVFKISKNPTAILIILNIVMLAMGCFIEATSLIIIMSPILMPIILQLNISPVYFGVIFVMNIMIATITPPVGICAYIASDIAGVTMQEFSKEVIPYIVAMLAFLGLLIIFPQIVLFLPGLFF